MKWKFLVILPVAFALSGCPWDKDKSAESDKSDKQKDAHDSFVGSPPPPSKPYNILDYTKPPPKQ